MENHFEGWFYCWYLSKLQKVIAIPRNIVRHLDKYEDFSYNYAFQEGIVRRIRIR